VLKIKNTNRSCFFIEIYFIVYILFFFIPNLCKASVEPLSGPANWGGTGLMETPTARVLEENRFRAGASQINPYRHYYIAVSPLKGLEIDGRITEILGVEAISSAYGNYKDKVFDVKYKFIEEGKYNPAVSIGIMDPHGTRIYASQYLVASKQIHPFDFTVGFGNGRFGKRPLSYGGEGFKVEMFQDPRGWFKDSQFFWGIQFAPSEKFAFMIEYSPIKYEKQIQDPAQAKYFNEPVKSNFNYGLRLKPWKWADVDFSYQRGNQFGVNLSMAFDIGQPLIPIYDQPYREKQSDRTASLQNRLVKALHESGFSNIGIDEHEHDLFIEAQNNKYYFTTKAIGVILKIVNDIAPYNIQYIHIILTQNQIPIVEFTTDRNDVNEYFTEKLSGNDFLHLSKTKTDTTETTDAALKHKEYFSFGFKPDFHPYLESREGFFKYRLGASGWAGYHPWKGMTFVVGLETYPINDIPVENEGTSKYPVRSDVALFLKNKFILGKLMFDQIFKMPYDTYGRFSGGFLEYMYAGFDGEIAKPLFNGRFLVGLSGSIVRQRDPDKYFELRESFKDVLTPLFFNVRFNIPEYEMSFDAKIGKFLAGDKGVRLTFNKFIHGVIFSAWYSWTDTSMFNDYWNRGYHDKGVAIKIPLRLFKGSDSKTVYEYSISPWTRDVAQDIDHHTVLFDLFGRNTNIYLDKDKSILYK
jgi:hypothetical protein